MRSIGIVGVPANSSGSTEGVARAPEVLREAGLVDALRRTVDVRDYGDVSLPPPTPERDTDTGLIDPHGFARLVPGVRDAVRLIFADQRFPLVIGGDCPLLLGCLVATRASGRVGLLFVDGHEDGYLPSESATGEAADTELAFALGIADASWSLELSTLLPVVHAEDVRIVGARDAETLRKEGVRSLADRVPLVDVDAVVGDPAGIAGRASSSLVRPWWFHLDLDVLSSEALLAIDYPQPGGLDWASLSLVAMAALSNEPVGWDVTIYNPDLDPGRAHAARIVRFIGSVIEQVSALHPS